MIDLKTIFGDEAAAFTSEEAIALSEYAESVGMLSSGELNLEFNNKDEFHAAIVMSAIFKTAKKTISIFTGKFSGEISNNPYYREQLEIAAKNPEKNIEVIFEETPNKDSLCLQMLRKLKSEGRNVAMYLLNGEYRNKLTGTNILNHFIVGDDHMFRYETDKNHFKAYCNFDDKKIVQLLNNNFSIFRLNSVDYK